MNAPLCAWSSSASSFKVTLEVTFNVLAPQILRITRHDLASKWHQLMGKRQ